MISRTEEIFKSNETIISKTFLFCFIPSSLMYLIAAVLGHACVKLLHEAMTIKNRKTEIKTTPTG